MFPQKQGQPSFMASSSSPSASLPTFSPAVTLPAGESSLHLLQHQQQQEHYSPQQLQLQQPQLSAPPSFPSSHSPYQEPLAVSLEDQRSQQLERQRFLLQQQQHQAQIQLQNLQLRQRKALIEEQTRQLAEKQQQLPRRASSSTLSPQTRTQVVSTTAPATSESFSGHSPSSPASSLSVATLSQALSSVPSLATPQANPSFIHPFLNAGHRPSPPNLLSPSLATTASMDIMALAPFPLHQHHGFTSNSSMMQQPLQQLTAQSLHDQQQSVHQLQQQQQCRWQTHGASSASSNYPLYHPLRYDSEQQGREHQQDSNSHVHGRPSRGISNRGSSSNSNGHSKEEHPGLLGYTINARIIQKKDQMEELSPEGTLVPAPAVAEVRTGQQFLIKLQLSRPATSASSSSFSRYPTMRVDRREAINTAGQPRAKAEPLTLQIIVRLAKTGLVRKGACAKCCHKYGPSSPIIVLLDPLSPSSTDPSSFAHVDSTTGSVTILAKVICSSTDHGERGNKDRYLFEFKLKRTNLGRNSSPRSGVDDERDTIASCVTAPIMCSGHHKAKRAYPNQRPTKVTKDGPSAKIKTIKHQRSLPIVDSAFRSHGNFPDLLTSQPPSTLSATVRPSSSMSSYSNFPSPLSYMQDNLATSSMTSNFGDEPSSDLDQANVGTRSRQQSLMSLQETMSSTSLSHQFQSQPPRIFEVRPDQGPIRKLTDVVLRGLFFQEGMVPYFGCFPAEDIVVETSSLILCKAPQSPLPGTVPITLCDQTGASFADLAQFTYTDDSETELLILQLQLRMAHRALEYLHTQVTGQKENANEILRDIPGLSTTTRTGGSSHRGGGGGNMMTEDRSMEEEEDIEPKILTRDEVEQGILKTLDQLPGAVDLSMQLENQGNMLHLSIVLGFHQLAMRLIEDGCDLEALDAWAMTPLMYAVIKGRESIVKALVVAGATSSGARTPTEFYACLPRVIEPTRAVVGYLSIACTRHSTVSRTMISSTIRGKPDTIKVENDSGSFTSSDEDSDMAELADIEVTDRAMTMDTVVKKEEHDEATAMAKIADAIRGVYINHDMPPLDLQDLPPMHTVAEDGSMIINRKVLKGDEIPRGVVPSEEYGPVTTSNVESGYYSKVMSEVQDRLSHSNQEDLPSEGVAMTVQFKKGPTMGLPATPSATRLATPESLYRTGESFEIEIRLATVEAPTGLTVPPTTLVPFPKEFVGIRFAHEMVKRVHGKPVSILNERTYELRMSVELGKPRGTTSTSTAQAKEDMDSDNHSSEQPSHSHPGDGVSLPGVCLVCSKALQQAKRPLGESAAVNNTAVVPILHFYVPTASAFALPTDADSTMGTDLGSSVVELRNGQLEVKAKVSCSSLHHLIRRDKARITTELQLQQQPQTPPPSSSSTASLSTSLSEKSKAELKDLDPGFVFTFELIHPVSNAVVAKAVVGPIFFQSYSLKR
ncbi:hypothetical protein EMPS_08144 [Entomortierella parvispora]|uniref:IPT/TIG domain-containing protein n=1 Tax=Entomortierella parvispora TaxID=205924 RepID=A0A9P3HFU3_9FUNG|nr:hypothetical protein EMPS_08144 [Entomortierella parvispora]